MLQSAYGSNKQHHVAEFMKVEMETVAGRKSKNQQQLIPIQASHLKFG
ncbi:MAG: hypothetical protein IGS49_26195 [Chlorogloeopsis fritschii C42_A2020_084]|nr:hypothetical protein [Chlorogloeopsis fritschii]MBF2008844.1 hypothetical protein [Chlorogloeopsis fritschii C42_A2020_084]